MTQFWHMSAAIFLTWLINLPFGYWRASLKKLSFKWFLAIHLPIPLVVAMRFVFHLGFQLYTYPFLVSAFFLGQFVGAWAYIKRFEKK